MFSRDDIAWDSAPPLDGGRFIPIIRAPAEGTIRALVVCPDLIGCMVHWNGTRTMPCRAGSEGCAGCRAKEPKKWLGYLGAWFTESDRLCLLEITSEAYLNCPEIQDGYLPDLRGWWVKLYRARPLKTARVCIEMLELVRDDAALPKPFDIRDTLARIWNGTMKRPAAT